VTASRVQRVRYSAIDLARRLPSDYTRSHVHVSLKSKDGRNIFAVSDADMKNGRTDAAFEDTKWLSREGEWFLAGVLDGLADVVPLVRVAS